MSDQAYANALKRREELSKELTEIDQFISLYKRYASETFKEQTELRICPAQTGGANGARPTLAPLEYARLAAAEILQAETPLTRGQLAERMIGRNVAFPTDDVPRYLGTILWRNRERFINVPGLGYAVPEIMKPEYAKRIFDANARSADLDKDTCMALQAVARDEINRLKEVGHSLVSMEPAMIPHDIDARLLNAAGDALGHGLYEPEKRYLREAFSLEALM